MHFMSERNAAGNGGTPVMLAQNDEAEGCSEVKASLAVE